MLRITILFTLIFSTTPPRPRVDFRRIPRSVPSKTQLEMVMLRTLPLISLPITTPPCPESIVQFVTVIFSQGVAKRRPCKSRPLLMVIQSSPTEIWQSEICTFLHDSGLIPSVLGDFGLIMVNPVILIFSLNCGFTVQKGELTMVTPSILMFLQRRV